MSFLAHARNPGKEIQPGAGLPLFDWRSSGSSSVNPLHIRARRISASCGVPFAVVLAHIELAGLGREVR
ncbi:hypothetical protein [Ancylobacter oerskovii]|uniref:Uncharacterized protein n=1 Tax=Ancylobacter oerskovii TaxID=459519 RepID=A0ABW4YVB1_9HYPH|nr:hypothetical protein [Ancylobacter oerskovii]MBS7543206.1 hypothetical protein [Ancylobacter oerskovii]